ncbi:translation initiation factor IF-2 [Candidatus Pelagibacter bacterium]|jgi:translation initiation factor IF-2|nr:translation initiation factor IF-2 [Candidatus Pelagibacter bacterium]|tara:strand:- start:532 stop:2712 length:2181 start_codon:yes stop_codon:yes gene_type:complete
MDKDKKKTLTISSDLKKKIDTSSISTSGKKSFSVEKKKPFRSNKSQNKTSSLPNINFNNEPKKKNFARKFVEEKATKDFIKKDNKPTGKSKLKLKGPVDKRDFKLTVSRALNVEEIEIKQRSLASVKRARLKEKKKPEGEEKKEFKKVIKEVKIPEQITIQELSNRMAEKSSDIIKFLFNMKVVATINHNIDKDTAEYIVKEFGHKPILEEKLSIEKSKSKAKFEGVVKSRPPVVTIMGHVDHGKTSLLDSLRESNVVSGEHGGITQHIGAYQVKTENNKLITFIDTPGHAAFTEMRARGSKITDIVVLVVAADDGIKPQTVEAIKHAKAAKVPIIVAINKCDLPEKNISKIKNEMMQYELIAEDLSGDTLFVEVSALKKINLDKLKESILLQSEILDLKASFSDKARGVVIESKIDKGKGPVSTILISNGKLKRGDYFICGDTWGKIRAMIDYEGKMVNEALPSMPVEILGMNNSASAGAEFVVTDDEDEAKELSELKRNNTAQNKVLAKDKTTLFEDVKDKDELNIIIKSDVQGSSEALKMAINKIEHKEVQSKIILSDIGMINETDVSLAKASNAILLGFNVKPNREAKKLAEEQKVDIKYFNIIYEALEHVEKSLSGLLEPDIKETVLGSAEIQKIFKVSTAGKIAGSKVISGEIKSKSKARIIRDGVVVYSGEISSIFREKNQVKEVGTGLECGISIKDFLDFKEKDVIESYLAEEIQRSI